MYNCRCVYACVHTFCTSSRLDSTALWVKSTTKWHSSSFHSQFVKLPWSCSSDFRVDDVSLSPPLSQTDNPVKTLWVSSNAEQAMRKALFHCFRRATTVACQRHLKNNAIHYAQDVVGMSRSDRQSWAGKYCRRCCCADRCLHHESHGRLHCEGPAVRAATK